MTERISIGQLYPNSVPPAAPGRLPVTQTSINTGSKPFHEVLQDRFVRFSHHAEQRLMQRGIQLKPEQLAQIESAIEKAAAKGAKDSLMILDGTALIVNIKNKTVVTAMDTKSMKDHVFTQIDSAVVIS